MIDPTKPHAFIPHPLKRTKTMRKGIEHERVTVVNKRCKVCGQLRDHKLHP